MKNFYSIFTVFILSIWFMQQIFADNVPDGLIPTDNKIAGLNTSTPVVWVVEYVRSSIFWLLPLIAIAVFLYVGFKLIVARWNPEEFKKAWKTFIYAVIGIFVVSFAWVAVKLVSGIDI